MKTVREFMNASRRKTGERRVEAWLQGRGLCAVQSTLAIPNEAGAAFRGDVNTGLQANATFQSGAAAPGTTYADQYWFDTTTNTLKKRNAANSAWILKDTRDETFIIDRASNTILGLSDTKKTFRATAGFTQTITAAATLGDGWQVDYRVESGSTIVFDPNGAETIDGAATKSIVGPSSGTIKCNGTAFYTIGFPGSSTFNSASLVGSVTPFVGMINGTIVTTRGGSAETIAIKTLAGADPSAGDPVIFVFRNATAGTGDYVFLTATAALSITIPSTATLGASNSVLFRVWLTIFNDASTLRLGVVNCLSGTSILNLKDDDLRSSTLTPASSAQVIYTTGSAVTTKAMRLLGYLEYTLAAVGTWGTAPSKVQLFGPGVPTPGTLVQVARTQTGAVATGSTTIPQDDTIPQNTEGDQYMTQAITPSSAANLLEIDSQAILGGGGANVFIGMALFQDATANALAAMTGESVNNASIGVPHTLSYGMLAGTTSSTTFKIRCGSSAGSTSTFNGLSAGRIYGGVMNSYLTVREIMA